MVGNEADFYLSATALPPKAHILIYYHLIVSFSVSDFFFPYTEFPESPIYNMYYLSRVTLQHDSPEELLTFSGMLGSSLMSGTVK